MIACPLNFDISKIHDLNKNLVETKIFITNDVYIDYLKNYLYNDLDKQFVEFIFSISYKYGFDIHHNILIKYGVISDIKDSNRIKEKLKQLYLIENHDYICRETLINVGRGGTAIKKEYFLTKDAFNLCINSCKNHNNTRDNFNYKRLLILSNNIIHYYNMYLNELK